MVNWQQNTHEPSTLAQPHVSAAPGRGSNLGPKAAARLSRDPKMSEVGPSRIKPSRNRANTSPLGSASSRLLCLGTAADETGADERSVAADDGTFIALAT